jgi:Calcineurin-like phosphoesterase
MSGVGCQRGSRLRRLWIRHFVWAAISILAWFWAGPATASSPLHRIVAVGDLHGDFTAWRDITRAAQLVNDEGSWIGADAVLIQTGDAVDRGPDSLKIIQDIMRLQLEARRAHGQVIALVGNHEAMNMTGDLRYLSAEDFATYTDRNSIQRRERVYEANRAKIQASYRQRDPQMTDDAVKQAWFAATPLGSIEHQIAWAPQGKIGRWIAGNPAILMLDGTLFVHGGISPNYVNMPIAEINRQVDAALQAKTTDPGSIINDPLGPLWYRGLAIPNADAADESAAGTPEAAVSAAPAEPPIEDQLNNLLAAYGAKRIVIGHTPILSGIALLYGGRLIRIDTGISQVYGGAVSYLDIVDDVPIVHAIGRSQSSTKEGAQ